MRLSFRARDKTWQEASILRKTITVVQASAVLIGVVVGTGILRTPPVVAANVSSETEYLGVWLLGGVVTLIGALCYAELGSAFPHVGGEYHYLREAYGPALGFLFAWGRMTVMQSGSIAAVAYVYGDYATYLIPAGASGPALHAASAIIALSVLQLRGTELSSGAQLVLTIATVAAVLLVAVIGLVAGPPAPPAASSVGGGAVGLAMVFVLLTYGGWSETAYLSGETRDATRDIPRALVLGTTVVTILYLFANLSFVRVLGLEGLRQSNAVAADLVQLVAGDAAAMVVAGIVCITCLSTLNATIFTGARSIFALGRSFAPFAVLGEQGAGGRSPRNAIVVQATITIGLVVFGALARDGFQSMVEYTAPVFWTFLLLVGIALFVLRCRDPERPIPFRTPLYPLTPLLFCATSAYLLHASLAYTGAGALLGLGFLAAGIPIYVLGRPQRS
ncbi:MAG: amino acid permease [Pseudomonadota bacterium]